MPHTQPDGLRISPVIRADTRMRWVDQAVYSYIAQRGDEVITKAEIATQSGDGIYAVDRALNHLAESGYLTWEEVRENGRRAGRRYHLPRETGGKGGSRPIRHPAA